MASVHKKIRTSAQRTTQALRSDRNKARRITRAKKTTPIGSKNVGHRLAKLGNRLRRLRAKLVNAAADRKATYLKRIAEIEPQLV